MDDGIFKEIDDNLLDQHGIHGKHQKFFRYLYLDGSIRKALAQSADRLRNNLFNGFHGSGNFHGVGADPGYRKQVFNHI